jgi:hypothetical protein
MLASTRELVSNYYFLLFGFLSCLSAFVSEKKTVVIVVVKPNEGGI